MAWLAITNNPGWEYSTTPDVDDPDNDYTGLHTLGIRTVNAREEYVYCRQINNDPEALPGYGGISKTYWDGQT